MDKKPILIVESDLFLGKKLSKELSHNGFRVHLTETGKEALRWIEEHPPEVVIASAQLPDINGLALLEALKTKGSSLPVILMSGSGTVVDAVEAMRRGAYDYLVKPLAADHLETLLHRVFAAQPEPKKEDSLNSPAPALLLMPIITQNRQMKEILDLCRKIADSKATVLLQGESGTGKELFARFIHSQSSRSQGPFIAVNCASLPETLLESELFGHEKGAFTGAIGRKIGKFELAHRGTLLLDEISEMNTFLQAKILRVLQENEVDRIGGNHPIPVDIRVIATTNRDLESSIQKGEFREDLYYRLKVLDIHIPPLRQRREDVLILADHFLKKFSREYKRTIIEISSEAMEWLKNQEWRGNVRELKNAMERAVLIAADSILQIQDFGGEKGPLLRQDPGPSSSLSLREMEERLIQQALEKTEGNRTHAARILGISIRTLRNKLNEYKQNNLDEATV